MTSTRINKSNKRKKPRVPAADILPVAGGGEPPAEEAGFGVSGRGPPLAPLPPPQVTRDVHAAPVGREEVKVNLHEVQPAPPDRH